MVGGEREEKAPVDPSLLLHCQKSQALTTAVVLPHINMRLELGDLAGFQPGFGLPIRAPTDVR
jgi:hypothetical protein